MDGQGASPRAIAAGVTTVTRFAPSPTGRLHLGHAVSAIAGFDRARRDGGRFLLRIEDIDLGRCRPEFMAAIRDDLAWLGLTWDAAPLIQSERLAVYDEAFARIVAQGVAYPCFCSRADIAREAAASLSAPHGADGPLYPGTCRDLPRDPERLAREPHGWRLDAGAALARTGRLTWRDEIAGEREVDAGLLGDIILKARDRPASYHLAAVVDDGASGVTLVTRGRDLFASTGVQRILQALLGLPAPDYRHHRLVAGPDGRRLAKRDTAAGLDRLRESIDGTALADMLRAGRLPIGFGWLKA